MATIKYADYSLSVQDLMPVDEPNDATAETPRRTTATREDVLQMVLSRLQADDSPLYELIDEELSDPSERGRTPRVHPMTAIRVCRSLTEHIMEAIDQHTDRLSAVEGDAHD